MFWAENFRPSIAVSDREDRLLDLTTVEFDLLAALIRSAGATVSRERLARDVLGREFSPFDRSIRSGGPIAGSDHGGIRLVGGSDPFSGRHGKPRAAGARCSGPRIFALRSQYQIGRTDCWI